MDSSISISTINDFLYCPRSLYFHSIYGSFSTSVFHDIPQVKGGIAHENIDKMRYTTSSGFLQGLSVYCSTLGIKGRIDLYDVKNKFLIERKNKVKMVHKGFKYQLYAQLYCLQEVGFEVKRLFIHSLSDNKRYEVSMPTDEDKKDFEAVISQMKSFDVNSLRQHKCQNCQNNIYSLFNW